MSAEPETADCRELVDALGLGRIAGLCDRSLKIITYVLPFQAAAAVHLPLRTQQLTNGARAVLAMARPRAGYWGDRTFPFYPLLHQQPYRCCKASKQLRVALFST